MVERSTLRRLAASSPRHRVERFDQRSELVVALRLDALIEAAGADFARRRRQHLHRPGDPLGEVQPHPGRADQNQQRHHQEERQIDAGQRPLQHAQLVVVLEGLGHAPRARREIAGQVVGRDDARRSACRPWSGSPPRRAADRRQRRAFRSIACPPVRRAPAPPGDRRPRGCSRAAASAAATSTTGSSAGQRPARRHRRDRPRPSARAAA